MTAKRENHDQHLEDRRRSGWQVRRGIRETELRGGGLGQDAFVDLRLLAPVAQLVLDQIHIPRHMGNRLFEYSIDRLVSPGTGIVRAG